MYKNLEQRAKRLRQEIFEVSLKQGEPHFGGCFSCVEILTALYKKVMKKDDKFILSAGHKGIAWYPLLKEKGYNPKILMHPDKDIKNGIELYTGSLGHGICVATGMALAKKKKKEKGIIYTLVGDGEMHEGSCWETLNMARDMNLENLVIIIDYNKQSAIDKTKYSYTFKDRLKATDCAFYETNGHNFKTLIDTFKQATYGTRPHIILANTIKGKGVSFMEGDVNWHNLYPNEEQIKQIKKELYK